MASISERENREIEAANASGDSPVVFIHGLWLLPSSWANWVDFFKQAGRLGLHVTTSQALAADPAGTALAALSQLPLATPWTFARHRRTRGGGRCPWIWCYVRPSCVASPKKYLHANYTPPPCRLQPSLR